MILGNFSDDIFIYDVIHNFEMNFLLALTLSMNVMYFWKEEILVVYTWSDEFQICQGTIHKH